MPAMKMIFESSYLYYILQFTNKKIKICHFIDETFCKQSIQGVNLDSYHQIYDKSYQFAFFDDHCIVRPLKNFEHNLSNEILWIQAFLNKYLARFHEPTNKIQDDSIIQDDINQKNQQIFYLRMINIKLELKLFEKIINRPDDYRKNYSSEEVFFICHSYVFSILDNRFTILKNILYLILKKSCFLNDIHLAFLNYALGNYKNTKYLKDFKYLLLKKQKIDLSFFIDQFLNQNHHSGSSDEFLSALFNWNLKIMNLIFLIRQTFCFNIQKDENITIMKFYQTPNYESTFNSSIHDFVNLLPFLSDKCVFLCEQFFFETHELFALILKTRKDIEFEIDITKFYRRIDELFDLKIIHENAQLENFLEFLFKKINQPIILIIDSNKFLVEKKNNTFHLSMLDEKIPFKINKSLLISSNILIRNFEKVENLLKNIAEIIFLSSVNQEFGNIEIIFSNRNRNFIQYPCSNNIENKDSAFNKFFQDAFKNNPDDSIESIFINGLDFQDRIFISINEFDRKFHNIDSLVGLLNDDSSLLFINSESQQLSLHSDFVQKLGNIYNIKTDQSNVINLKSFEFFNSDLIEMKYLIFHINSQSKEEKLTNLTCSFSNLCQEILHCNICAQKFEIKLYNEMTIKNDQILKLYHKSNNVNDNFTEKKELQNSSFRKLSDIFFDLEVKFSNFHIIVSNFVECKSIDQNLSSIVKNDHLLSHQIKVRYCHVKFLNTNFHIFDHITMNNCTLACDFELFSDKFHKTFLNIKFINFRLLIPLRIFNFAKIESFEPENEFSANQDDEYHGLGIRNCLLTIFGDIPQKIKQLILSKCKIDIHDSSSALNSEFYENRSSQSSKSSVVNQIHNVSITSANKNLYFWIYETILPDEIHISGMFGSIKLMRCSSSCTINTDCERIDIRNHQGKFTVNFGKNKVISTGINSCLKIDEKNIHIINMKNVILIDVKYERIEIENCYIEKMNHIKYKMIRIRDSVCLFRFENSRGYLNNEDNKINFFDFEKNFQTLLSDNDDNNSEEIK